MLRPDVIPLKRSMKPVARNATILPDVTPDDPQFLHALLCQLGLPRRPTQERVFERTSGRASLIVEAGRWFTGSQWEPQPLPYGTRPRLVLINICSEAVRTKSPVVDIGESVRAFLRRLGIDCGGQSMANFKRQMIALSCCRLQLGYVTGGKVGQIDSKPVSRFEAWLSDEEGQRGLWPGELELSGPFFESLMSHAVPLDGEAIGKLQHSALALDVYSWLAHRLCRVESNAGQVLSWTALKGQFGQEFAETKEFRRTFLEALKKAHEVYRDARLEVVRGGLRLLPSPPPCRKERSVIALAAPAKKTIEQKPKPTAKAEEGAGTQAVRVEALVSSRAMEQVSEIAPGWDKYYLEATYKDWVVKLDEMPRNADAAFLGWVRKFTKGKTF
jgi:hypothetical protein